MATESTKLLLKDQLINKEKVHYLSCLIQDAYPQLNQTKFEKDILEKLPGLELKERFYWIREMIERHLPADYNETLTILLKCLENEPEKEEFIFAAFSDYAAANGCDQNNLDRSLDGLAIFTKYCSAEFAIRDFINKFPEETFIKMQDWSLSNNVHQRRLASEGLRPKLPWSKAINFDYKKGSLILDQLYYDRERYVTRSVANHLNDISKIDPDFVLEKLEKWQESKKQTDKEMTYIIRHSLRTAIKKAHVNTINFLGYNTDLKLNLYNFKIEEKNITLGEALKFSFEISAETPAKLIIDYKIIYPNPGNRHSEKIFKIKTTEIKKNEKIVITKMQYFKKMTTKRLYSGQYKLAIQINGKIIDALDFYLKV